MANDPQPEAPKSATITPPAAQDDTAARQQRAVEAIRQLLQGKKVQEAAAGQIHTWMDDDQ